MTPDRYRWAVLSLTVVAFMQTHLHRMAFAPLIPTFVADLGLTYAAAGTIQTAYFWTYAVSQVPIGVIADRWGARRVMAACAVTLAVGGLAFAVATSYTASILARMVVGLGAAAVWVPGMQLITQWFPPSERGRAAGLMSAGRGLGGSLGLVLVPVATAALGWRLAYGLTVVPAVLTLGMILLVLRRPPPGVVPGRARAARGALRRVLAVRAIWPLNVNVVFSYGGWFSFVTFLPAYLVRGLGFTHAQAGVITGLVTAGTMVSWPLAGFMSDRLGRRRPVFLFSQLVSVAGLLFFALGAAPFGLVGIGVAAFITGLLVGGMILPFVMVVDFVPRELAATAAGVTNGACFAGAMVLPIVMGRIVDVTGSFAIAFLVAAAVQAAAFVAGLFVAEPPRDAYNPGS
ncbi:MAG TPA: MFS transporter [Terriglobales bacterium]|nr:MFS transporter [Terriglobales bacterium]